MGFSKQEACMHVLDLRVGLCNEMYASCLQGPS